MVAAMAECRPGERRQRRHQLIRRQALRREPSCCIGEGSSPGTDYNGNQHQGSKHRTRLGHSNLAVTVAEPSSQLTIPVR